MTTARGIYKATPTAMQDNQQREMRLDNFGALVVNTANADGTYAPGGGATDPAYTRSIGATNSATGQATTSVSPAAATLIVGARAGRQAVVISNITGTQPIYFTNTASTTGATTGFFLAAAVGATITISTAGPVYATAPTAAQTVSFWENY